MIWAYTIKAAIIRQTTMELGHGRDRKARASKAQCTAVYYEAACLYNSTTLRGES